MHDSRRPPYDFPPERYPIDYDRRRDRDLYDERLDARRPWDREFRHPDDDPLTRDRFLDERDAPPRREAFDYNHGGKRDDRVDRRDKRRSHEVPEKPKPKVTPIGTLLDAPGREKRPERVSCVMWFGLMWCDLIWCDPIWCGACCLMLSGLM